MAVGLTGLPLMHPVDGIRLAAAEAGIKKPGRRDLVLIEAGQGTAVAAVFTRNAFCAAPVSVARRHLTAAAPRFLLINTGYANAGTGEQGIADAEACCRGVAAVCGCDAAQVLPFSTGVIGEPLPVERLVAALPDAGRGLAAEGWADAATGIMTTDTVPKGASRRIEVDGVTLTVTGIAKGAGMIRPNMATMLGFVATDAPLTGEALQGCLEHAVGRSFNRVTVDGDTSTNDACVLMATGKAALPVIDRITGPAYEAVCEAVTAVCMELAQALVRDGEGATKFITVWVRGGTSVAECDQVAYTIAHSPLVKTALFASDPNWGRILAAVGRAGLPDLEVNGVALYLDDVCIARNGGRAAEYTEAQGQAVMNQEEITIRVELGRGEYEARVWTCDFSYDYVRINADYRT